MESVTIRTDMIRLGQFLKLADLVESGADAKTMLDACAVSVNGSVETRRGRQLHRGDVVRAGDREIRVDRAGDAGHPGRVSQPGEA